MKEKAAAWIVQSAKGPYALPALALLSFAESVFFFVPVEAMLIPFIVAHKERWKLFVLVATLASSFGGVAGYSLGFFFYDTYGMQLIALYGLEEAFASVSDALAHNVFSATFVSAFTPIPYKVFTLSAGLLAAPFFLFLLASLLGRGLRFLAVGYITERFGMQVTQLAFKRFTHVTVGIVLVFIFIAVLYLLLR